MVSQSKSIVRELMSAEDVTVNYGKFAALREVNLSVEKKSIHALVGPSGCGKSTFLNTLNRMTDLIPGCEVKGDVKLGGESIYSSRTDLLKLRKRVGMVFQKPNPFPQSIRRNFEIPLREHGYRKDEVEAKIDSVLKDVGLWDEVKDRLNGNATKLSGGQQQRLCIARALALDPEVILFDEPCSSLDPIASGKVEELIAGLKKKVTVVIVTHNLAQARRLADSVSVFWLRDGAGTIIETGPTESIFNSPKDEDAARYLNGLKG